MFWPFETRPPSASADAQIFSLLLQWTTVLVTSTTSMDETLQPKAVASIDEITKSELIVQLLPFQ